MLIKFLLIKLLKGAAQGCRFCCRVWRMERREARMARLQILDKKYAALLREKGVPEKKIRVYGFAFR